MKKNSLQLISGIILLAVLLGSCKKKEGDLYLGLSSIRITLLNQQSQNLLAPPSTINGNIQMLYLIDGKEYFANNKGWVKESNGKYGFELLPNTTSTEAFPITLIRFGNLGTDTIKCQFSRDNGLIVCTKVWLNGQLKSDIEGRQEITIVK